MKNEKQKEKVVDDEIGKGKSEATTDKKKERLEYEAWGRRREVKPNLV